VILTEERGKLIVRNVLYLLTWFYRRTGLGCVVHFAHR